MTPEEIKLIRITLRLKQQEMADLLDVSKRSIANYESGESTPNARTEIQLKALQRKLQKSEKVQYSSNKGENELRDLAEEYLIEDILGKINVNDKTEVFSTKSGNVIEELPDGKYLISVPLIPHKAQATYISEYQDAEYIEGLTRVTFMVDHPGQGSYRAFEIMNDSMNDGTIDSIPHGTIVLGRELQKHHWKDKLRYRQFPNWIIVHKDSIVCKEIVNHDVEKGIITCHSLNNSPEYQDFDLHLNDVHQLYNIVKRQL